MLKKYMISLIALTFASGLFAAEGPSFAEQITSHPGMIAERIIGPDVEPNVVINIKEVPEVAAIREQFDILEKVYDRMPASREERERYKSYLQEKIRIYQDLLQRLDQAKNLEQFRESLKERLPKFKTPPPFLEQ